MSIVKDLSLSPSGLQKIQWVRDFMPALGGIEERFRREKPFEGLTIAVSVHLEAKTANLGLVLREGGAPGVSHRLQPPVHPGRCGRCHGQPGGGDLRVSTGWTCGAMRTC